MTNAITPNGWNGNPASQPCKGCSRVFGDFTNSGAIDRSRYTYEDKNHKKEKDREKEIKKRAG